MKTWRSSQKDVGHGLMIKDKCTFELQCKQKFCPFNKTPFVTSLVWMKMGENKIK